MSLIAYRHVEDCCAVAATTLVLYDHMRTFARETDLIWGQRISSTTIVFHLNRWLGFTWAVTNLVSVFVPIRTLALHRIQSLHCSDHSSPLYSLGRIFNNSRACNQWWKLVFIRNGVLTESGSRRNKCRVPRVLIYAYSQHTNSWIIHSWVLHVALHSCFHHGQMWRKPHFLFWPFEEPNMKQAYVDDVSFVQRIDIVAVAVSTRACLLVADLLVILLTWARTFRSNRKPDSGNARMNSLSTLLLRDGTLYFIILSALNILNLVGIVTASFNYATSFVTPLYCIIVSHFLLDLRGLAQMSQEVSNDNYAVSSHMSNAASLPVFKTIDSTSSRVDLFDTDRHLNWREEEEKAM
ncbi:hypothetical protein CERSUDRAFT_74040 [Gelatoporia subvermispora B]|uniref:DUF6533 domain-containing protein n=1 Tax=Ceriporiopsis subvermispora (strain B) TaxID=914234 RepID=M2QJ33_CERS8|nr:hypothetical protein CERSUDRAFT_74040 [Gelatoporia subvermispora B]